MTQEDKELLLKKDLCARLPYGVKLEIKYQNGAWMLFAIYYAWNKIYAIGDGGYPIETNFADCKPYLFPLSSMTEEQQINLTKFVANGINGENILYDWLNQNHFDYRGLIEKGLAIDASELNIYKTSMSNNPQITIGTKIRSKTKLDEILTIISDDCHEDEFECSDGSVLSLKQIKKYYDII